MKWLMAAAAAALLSVVIGASQNVDEQSVAQALDRYLSIRAELGHFSGAVLVARHDRIIYRKAFGYADLEKNVPYRLDTPQRVASISKMFTAAAALKLRSAGKLRLDDSICKYLRGCPDSWKAITAQHLMRHTSGIPDYEEKLGLRSDKYLEFMRGADSSGTILQQAKSLPLDFEPGSKFNYSNTGYVVLAYVIEQAAGQPFTSYVANALLKPAGMDRSGAIDSDVIRGAAAAGYTHEPLDWKLIVEGVSLQAGHLRRLPTISYAVAHGDAWLYSTVEDLWRWSRVMNGGQLLSASEVREILTPGLGGYGYGWMVGSGFDRPRNRHNGQVPGYLADFVRFPNDGVTIVVLTNVDRTRLNPITRDISAITLGTPYDLPIRGRVIELTVDQLKRIEGNYRLRDGQVVTVRQTSEGLEAESKGRFKTPLVAIGPTEFFVPIFDGRATFDVDAAGNAGRLNLRYSGDDHVAERWSQ